MAVKQLSDGNPSGTTLGQDSTDLVSFYGATPVDQAAAITKPGTTASTASTPVGYTTTTQADAIVTAVRALIDALGSTSGVGITA